MVKLKRGRPNRYQIPIPQIEDFLVQAQDKPHILAENPYCLQIFFLLATQGKFQITIETGPHKQSQLVDNTQKNNAMKKINETFRLYNSQKLNFFFLSNQVKKFSIENNLIIDNTIYRYIDSSKYINWFQYLIQILNVVCKELDPIFIVELEKILEHYYDAVLNLIDPDQIAEAILQIIKNPKNHADFQYLLLWNDVKKLIKDIQKEYDKNRVQKIRSKALFKKTSQKVIKKHEEYIKKLESELALMDQEPIDYLITKLIEIFNNIIRLE